jgi:hypothetical protein
MEFKGGRRLLLGRGHRQTFRLEEEEGLTGGSGLTGGVHASVSEGEVKCTVSVFNSGRAEAEMLAGPDCFPEALFIFLFLFFFFFFCFLYFFTPISKLNQKIQTNFVKFLKFKTIIQNSKIQVFIIKTTFHKIHVKWPKVFICIMQIEIGF